MGLLKDCEDLFGTDNLYELLKVNKDATEAAIKQAYRKLSLKVHPDRAPDADKENATQRFQVLSKVSRILLDKDLRSIYDEDGDVDDESAAYENNIKDWTQYWNSLFNITVEDMRNFEESYRETEIESDELKTIYVECEGDMDMIFEKQICCTIDDEPRFRKILQDAIDKGDIPDFDNFSRESKAKKRKRQNYYKKEAKAAEKAKRELGLAGQASKEEDLKQLILKRQGNRQKEMDSFLNNLEAKYAKPSKSKKSAPATSKKKRKKM